MWKGRGVTWVCSSRGCTVTGHFPWQSEHVGPVSRLNSSQGVSGTPLHFPSGLHPSPESSLVPVSEGLESYFQRSLNKAFQCNPKALPSAKHRSSFRPSAFALKKMKSHVL